MALVFLAAVITYLDRVCISVAAPSMQADLGLTQRQFSFVFTAFYVAYTLAEMPAAVLGDRWGQRVTLVRIVGCWSLFTVITGLTRSLTQLLTTRFLFGAGEAGAFPTLSRALSRWFPAHERSRANGLMWTGARLGGAISPALAVMVMAWFGWRWAFALFGLLGLAWCAVCWSWFRDDPADHAQVNQAELAEIRVGAAPPPAHGQKVPWLALITNRDILFLFASYFASGFGFQFFVTWLPTYLQREHGLTLTQSGLYASLPLAAGATGCALGGVIADWVTHRTGNLVLGRRLMGCGGFWMGALGFAAAIGAGSPGVAILCLAFASGAHDLTLPVLWATSTDIGGKFGGTASGWVNFASSLSGMLAPIAASELQQFFGSFNATFYVAASVYVIGGALWLFIDPRKKAIG